MFHLIIIYEGYRRALRRRRAGSAQEGRFDTNAACGALGLDAPTNWPLRKNRTGSACEGGRCVSRSSAYDQIKCNIGVAFVNGARYDSLMVGAQMPITRTREKAMKSTEPPKLTTARVQRICQSSVWHSRCGRLIQPGEKYLRVSAPGLSNFGVCSRCAAQGQKPN